MTLSIIRFAQATDVRNGYGGGMCKRTPKTSTKTGPCTFAIEQFGRVHEIRFSLTVSSRRLILAASPELRDSAQKARHPNTDRYVTGPRAPDSVAQEVTHDPQTDSQH